MKEITYGYYSAIYSHKDQYDTNIIVMKVTGEEQNVFIELVDSEAKIPMSDESSGESNQNKKEGLI